MIFTMASFERFMNPFDLTHSDACSPMKAMQRSTNVSAHLPPAFSWISIADWRNMQALSTAIVARTWSSHAFFRSLSPKSWAMAKILKKVFDQQSLLSPSNRPTHFITWNTFESCSMILAEYTYVMNCLKSSWLICGNLMSVGVPAGEGSTVEPGMRQISAPRFEPSINAK